VINGKRGVTEKIDADMGFMVLVGFLHMRFAVKYFRNYAVTAFV